MRRDDFLAEPSFYFVRFGGHYWLSEKLTLTFGYAHMWLPPSQEGWETWSNENRIYQQLQYAGSVGRLAVVQRVRNEQRWKQEVVDDSLTGESSFSDRVRYLLSLSLPVAKAPRPLALVLSDEILLQFGHSVVLNTFDQNRLFGGIKVSLSRAGASTSATCRSSSRRRAATSTTSTTPCASSSTGLPTDAAAAATRRPARGSEP